MFDFISVEKNIWRSSVFKALYLLNKHLKLSHLNKDKYAIAQLRKSMWAITSNNQRQSSKKDDWNMGY